MTNESEDRAHDERLVRRAIRECWPTSILPKHLQAEARAELRRRAVIADRATYGTGFRSTKRALTERVPKQSGEWVQSRTDRYDSRSRKETT